jgi:hypothetical protein
MPLDRLAGFGMAAVDELRLLRRGAVFLTHETPIDT